jgi:hypothetical protein
MKTTLSSVRLGDRKSLVACCLAAASITAQSVLAQPTSTAPTNPPKSATAETPSGPVVPAKVEEEPEAITLSPFEVKTERDTGWAATSAGDGTRLGLDLRDTPASYMVLTRDFMDDLGIIDLQAASAWATNSGEVVDPQGSDTFANVGGFLQRFRGIGQTGGQQRDFYTNPGVMDSYSLERIDFGRGPNAALFNPGLLTGSQENALAGAQSATSKRARLDRPFQNVRATLGSWNFTRGELDINQPINSKLGFRLNGMWMDREGWRHREFESRHGVAVATTYRISPKSEIRLVANNDTTRRNNPGIDIFDQLSGWDGKTTFNGPVTNLQFSTTATPGAAVATGSALTFNGEPQGVNRRGGVYYVFVPGQGAIMNRQNEATTRRADETNRVPMYGANGVAFVRGSALPFGNGDTSSSTPSTTTVSPGIDFRYAQALPPERFANAINNSGFRVPGKRDALSTDTPLFTQHNKDVNLAFTRQFGDAWFFEIGIDANDTHNRHLQALSTAWARTSLDINQTNPDGTANPYFLQPYNDAPLREVHRFIENRTVRANLARNLDLGSWGRYQLNLNTGSSIRHTQHLDQWYSLGLLPDPRMGSGSDEQVRFRYYWNNPQIPYTPEVLPASLVTRTFATNNNTWTTGTRQAAPRWVPSNWNETKEKIDYAALAAAARFFDNKLIFVLAPRFDRYYQHVKQSPVFGDLPLDWNQRPFEHYRPDAPADYARLTYTSITGATGLAANTRPRQNTIDPTTGVAYVNNNGVQDRVAAYNGFRFRDDYSPPTVSGDNISGSYGVVYHARRNLSLLTNYATSYVTPLAGNFDLRGNIVEPRSGKGWDFAVMWELWDRQLTIKTTYYRNEENNVRIDPPIKSPINSLLSRNAATDPTTDGRNIQGISDIVGTDYQSQKTSGLELEVVGRITKNWRVLANVGTNKVVTFDRYTLARQFLAENTEAYVRVLQDAGGMLDTTQRPNGAPGLAVINPAVTPAIAAERGNAITDFNNIWTQAAVVNNDRPLTSEDTLVYNASTDYTFSTTFLKGLRLGVSSQWKGRQFVGYRTADTIVDSTGAVILEYPQGAADSNAVYFRMPVDVSASASYRWKLKNRREIDFTLRVRNLLNGQAVYYAGGNIIARPPGGDLTAANRDSVPARLGGFQVPISFQLTTTLKF